MRLRLLCGMLALAAAMPACTRKKADPPPAAAIASEPIALPVPIAARSAPAVPVVPPPADSATAVADTLTSLVVDAAIAVPRIDTVGLAHVLHLPPAMDSALRVLSPGFRAAARGEFAPDVLSWLGRAKEDVPAFAVVGDFDGDGRLDVAIEGNFGLVAILNRAEGPTAMCVKDRCGDEPVAARGSREEYVVLQARGVVKLFDEDGKDASIKIRRDGIQEIYFEKAAMLFYYDKGVWKSEVTDD